MSEVQIGYFGPQAVPKPDANEVPGVKFDSDKPRLDLVPAEALFALGKVLGYGATKYAARNWEKGITYSRVYAAALRHILAWWSGEDIDPESGLPHLWHALTNIVFLTTYTRRDMKEFDDRPIPIIPF